MNLDYGIQIDVRSLSKSQIYLIFLLLVDISYMISYISYLISKTKIITESLTENLKEDNRLLFIYSLIFPLISGKSNHF